MPAAFAKRSEMRAIMINQEAPGIPPQHAWVAALCGWVWACVLLGGWGGRVSCCSR